MWVVGFGSKWNPPGLGYSFRLWLLPLSRAGFEPALPRSSPDFNLSDRDLKRKKRKNWEFVPACLPSHPGFPFLSRPKALLKKNKKTKKCNPMEISGMRKPSMNSWMRSRKVPIPWAFNGPTPSRYYPLRRDAQDWDQEDLNLSMMSSWESKCAKRDTNYYNIQIGE